MVLLSMYGWLQDPASVARKTELDYFISKVVGNDGWKETMAGSDELQEQYKKMLPPKFQEGFIEGSEHPLVEPQDFQDLRTWMLRMCAALDPVDDDEPVAD